jgi:hypothetical protein
MPRRPSKADQWTIKDSFQHYWNYATLWRTWVVGIAVGAMFILLNKDVGGKFEDRSMVAAFFVAAAGVQVLLAWVNKVVAYCQYAEDDGSKSKLIGCISSIGNHYWIDCLLDFASLFLVGWAVVLMVKPQFSAWH